MRAYKSCLPLLTLATAIAAASAAPAQAFTLFFGEDINPNPQDTSSTFDDIVNSRAAEQDFLAELDRYGTEDFESFEPGTPGPLALEFEGLGSAILNGGGNKSSIKTVDESLLNDPNVPQALKDDIEREIRLGRNASSGDQYFLTNAAQNFQVDLESPAKAFGFYAYDLGDFEAKTYLDLYAAGELIDSIEIPNRDGSNASTNGSAFYFGLLSEDESEFFDQVVFRMNGVQGDEFAFDDLTISAGKAVPEPTTLLGLLGFGSIACLTLRKRSV
ncbi:MAG: PEP-CTERM sorting domain-containing protein [Spirulina sp. SIO3F2]|nr:PEP-CTERM sorting domain-containing protein [Spirulina sp. SIO3F2]